MVSGRTLNRLIRISKPHRTKSAVIATSLQPTRDSRPDMRKTHNAPNKDRPQLQDTEIRIATHKPSAKRRAENTPSYLHITLGSLHDHERVAHVECRILYETPVTATTFAAKFLSTLRSFQEQ